MIRNTLLMALWAILFVACTDKSSDSSKVMETSDGYKYQIVQKGKGKKAVAGEYAYFNAEVVSLDGEVVFSSSETGQPGVMKLEEKSPQGNASPFSEILLSASVGDSIHVFLGKDSGAQGSGFDSLIYKVGVFDILDEVSYNAKLEEEKAEGMKRMAESMAVATEVGVTVKDIYTKIKDGSYDNEIKTTDSGLKYIIHEEGTGEKYQVGENAKVNYYGVLSRNGEEFDNSWKRGQMFSFPLGKGRVIKGWDEGVALLNRGSKATLIIPGELGYGESGSGKIQPNDELIFYIEVAE